MRVSCFFILIIPEGLRSALDTMKIPLKLDVSTGDIITPKEIAYQYWLMFEERTIPVLAYNLETVLAEKLETVLRRGTANTRLRDFYDLFLLHNGGSRRRLRRGLYARGADQLSAVW